MLFTVVADCHTHTVIHTLNIVVSSQLQHMKSSDLNTSKSSYHPVHLSFVLYSPLPMDRPTEFKLCGWGLLNFLSLFTVFVTGKRARVGTTEPVVAEPPDQEADTVEVWLLIPVHLATVVAGI